MTEINQDVAEGLRKIWEDNFPTGMRKIDLYLPAGGMDILQGTMERLKLSNLAFNSMFSVFEYDKETSLSLFSHEFRFLKGKTPHHSHALRYRHRTSGRVAVCIGKTAWFEDLVDFCRGAHTLVADCPSPNPDQPESESSLRPGEIASLARLAGAKRIIINNCRQGRKYILENFTKKPDEDMEVYLNH